MKNAIHPKDEEFAGIPGYLARPQPKKRRPRWHSRLLGSMVENPDGTWSPAPQLERGPGGIQQEVEAYLDARPANYFRLPDLLMFAISRSCAYLPVNWKQHIADYITGWPDLLIPRLLPGQPYPVFLALELKTLAGRQSKGQREVGALVNCQIARSTADAIQTIETFFAWKPKEIV